MNEKLTGDALRAAVFENLNNRYDEGDETFDGDVDGECGDLIAYASDMEDCTMEELRPHVQAWADEVKRIQGEKR